MGKLKIRYIQAFSQLEAEVTSWKPAFVHKTLIIGAIGQAAVVVCLYKLIM